MTSANTFPDPQAQGLALESPESRAAGSAKLQRKTTLGGYEVASCFLTAHAVTLQASAGLIKPRFEARIRFLGHVDDFGGMRRGIYEQFPPPIPRGKSPFKATRCKRTLQKRLKLARTGPSCKS